MTVKGFIFYFISKQFTVSYRVGSIGALVRSSIGLIFKNNSLRSLIKISKNEKYL